MLAPEVAVGPRIDPLAGVLPVLAAPAEQVLQRIPYRLPLRQAAGSQLAHGQGSGQAVFIPGMAADHTADGLFKGQNTVALSRLLQLLGQACHVLKAGEGLIAGGAVRFCHPAGQLGGDQAFDQEGGSRQTAHSAVGSQQKIRQQTAGLVAGKGAVGAAVFHLKSHPVGVRICGDDQVGVHPAGLFQRQGKGGGVFRVGGGHSGECAIRFHLGIDGKQLGKTAAGQQPGQQQTAHPVEGRVDDAQLAGPGDSSGRLGQALANGLAVGFIQCLGQRVDQGGGAGRRGSQQGQPFHLGGHLGALGVGELGAAPAVKLAAIVFGGVVAGCDIQPTGSAQVAHGKGELRRGAGLGEEVDRQAQGRQAAGRQFGQRIAAVAGVVTDTDTILPGSGVGIQQPTAKGGDGLTQSKRVDASGAQRHHAPKARRAEMQAAAKIGAAHGLGHLLQVLPLLRRQCRAGDPALKFLLPIHPDRSFGCGFSGFISMIA